VINTFELKLVATDVDMEDSSASASASANASGIAGEGGAANSSMDMQFLEKRRAQCKSPIPSPAC
jgi:hypothetical protein